MSFTPLNHARVNDDLLANEFKTILGLCAVYEPLIFSCASLLAGDMVSNSTFSPLVSNSTSDSIIGNV